jgi:hypothetical protein
MRVVGFEQPGVVGGLPQSLKSGGTGQQLQKTNRVNPWK